MKKSNVEKCTATNFKGGWHGKILRVDLTKEKIWEEPLDREMAENNIGGLALAMQYMYILSDPQKNAFDEETPLIFATGPITATNAPSAGGFIVLTKSPLNGLLARGQANGSFGAKLKNCGYDMVIFTGKSKTPVYLWMTEDTVELRDATEYWGLNNFETEDAIIAATDKKTLVATIGRAGENLVKHACIQAEHGHVASSGGVGAVMGSKNLKALAANGSYKTKIYDVEKHNTLCKEWVNTLVNSENAQGFKAYGSAMAVDWFVMIGDLPTKNMSTNDSEKYNYIAGHRMHETFPLKTKTCYKCPVCHVKSIKMPDDNKYGLDYVEEPEYEGLASFGPFICVEDVYDNVYLNTLVDNYGMDYKTFAPILALCMECFEEGLLTADRFDGLELKWGDVESAAKFIDIVGSRKGLVGEVMADNNIREIAEWIGGDAPRRAVHIKGGGLHMHDARAVWGYLFSGVVSEFTTTMTSGFLSFGPSPEFGYNEALPNTPDKHAEVAAKLYLQSLLDDFAVVCDYCAHTSGVPTKMVLDMISAVTGIEYNYENGDIIANRLVNLARAYNMQSAPEEAFGIPSERVITSPVDGPNKGQSIMPYINDMVAEYTKEMGWDTKTGKPLPETLKRVGLEHVIADIWG